MSNAFDHERLDVYHVSIEFVAWANRMVADLSGTHRHARDQLLRSSQSIPLNIAEGNGKRGGADRKRFFEIARGSAMEAAATLDVLVAIGAIDPAELMAGKGMLLRVVGMLVRLAPPDGR
ncbi:MAG: four helix bundle protein [Planctomycetota bacterium]